MTRNQFNKTFGGLSVIAAVASLAFAIWPCGFDSDTHKRVGTFIVGAWVLLPPVFFWIDWVKYRGGLSDEEKEAVKHTHDLSRNIWLGLVAVLVVAFKLSDKFP